MKQESQPQSEFSLFFGFFRKALRRVSRMPLVLALALLVSVVGTDCLSLFESGMPLETYATPAERLLRDMPLLGLLIIPVGVVSVFLRTSLLLALAAKTRLRIVSLVKRAVRPFSSLFLLDAAILLALLLIGSALFAPSFLAGGGLADMLRVLGLVLFVIVGTVLLFTRTFAFFHITLSRVSFRAGLELGYTLFRKRVATSIVFAFVSVLVSIITSLAITLILRGLDALVDSYMVWSIMSLVISLALLTVHTAIQKDAWLSFFRFIASPEESEDVTEASQESEKVLQREVPETGIYRSKSRQ